MNHWRINRKSIIIPLVIIAISTGIWWIFNKQITGPAICPQDAMVCPDGTPVGRTGSDCTFAACPSEPQQNIKVSSPLVDQEIGLPLVINGEARVYENLFNYRLKDQDGSILVTGLAVANSPAVGQYGSFEIKASYPEPKGQVGSLELFSSSPETNAEINLTSIPVKFAQPEVMVVKVYFHNAFKDVGFTECDKTYPLYRRIAKTDQPARAALEELLTGVTINDINKGFITNINPEVAILSFNVDKGVAYADFNDMLQYQVGGTCRVQTIKSQIENTLKQFSDIKKVVISINGQTTDILKP